MRLISYEDYGIKRISRCNITLYLLSIVSLVLNGLNNKFINTIAILCVVLYIALSKGKNVLFIYPVVFIYMGYSNLNLETIGFTLDISTSANIIYLLIAIKLIISSYILRINKWSILYFLVLIVCCLNILITNKPSQALFMAAKLITVYNIITSIQLEKNNNQTDDGFTSGFILSLLIAIIGEVIYGVLFSTPSLDNTWRSAQFGGVKDPNNLSLHCCLLFALTSIVNPHAVGKQLKNIIEILMPIIIFASISFTGIVTILVFLAIVIWKRLNGIKKIVMSFFLFILLVVTSLINYPELLSKLVNSKQSKIAALAQRINLMLIQYRTGNYERLTSGRTTLWKKYFVEFQNQRLHLQVLGNSGNLNDLVRKFGIASHNVYIDFLISYGFIGSFLICILTLSNWVSKLHKRRYGNLIVNIVFAITFFSRSFDLSIFLLYVLL